MLATSLTAAVLGVEAHLIRVEADTAAGFPRFTVLGLPDSSIKESEGRIRAALRNCGYAFKWDRRITVSMAPASLRKTGSSYDLATAVGLLAADGSLPAEGPPGPRGGGGTAPGTPRAGDRGGGRPQRAAHGSSRVGQDDARAAPAGH